jgi:nucleoside-diphosphate-sugar epimerase
VSGLSVLFLGGTGCISSACAEEVIGAGDRLALLNRNTTSLRPPPRSAELLRGDVSVPGSVESAIGSRTFDVVVNFVAFRPDQVATDVARFRGRCGQYVFVSSASAYQKPIGHLPITESTPLANPFWQYSRDKIACEELLAAAYREQGFPVTVVRPSHTYDKTSLPLLGGWAAIERMRRGEPVVVHGDGTSLWVLTHHRDFARGFAGLLGRCQAIGDSFHITGDEVLTWDQIYRILGEAAGVEPKLVHLSSEAIASVVPALGPGLLGDKAHSVIFDNDKIRHLVPDYRATIPFVRGAREMIEWHDADRAHRRVDEQTATELEELVRAALQTQISSASAGRPC